MTTATATGWLPFQSHMVHPDLGEKDTSGVPHSGRGGRWSIPYRMTPTRGEPERESIELMYSERARERLDLCSAGSDAQLPLPTPVGRELADLDGLPVDIEPVEHALSPSRVPGAVATALGGVGHGSIRAHSATGWS